MSETLFRGLDINTGEWVFGCYRDVDGSKSILVPRRDIMFKVQDGSVGRYSGFSDVLKDRIFEGDIICYHKSREYGVCEFCIETGQFRVNGKNLSVVYSDSKILGNVIEDRELLKGVV